METKLLFALLFLSAFCSCQKFQAAVLIHDSAVKAAADMFVTEFSRRDFAFNWTVVNYEGCGSIDSFDYWVEIALSPEEVCSPHCGPASPTLRSEEFRLCTSNRSTSIYASGLRSAVFGVGKVLRMIDFSSLFSEQLFTSAQDWVSFSPDKSLRGQMISYRALSNSYDGWDVGLMEQYIRDLAAYGTNFIEMVAPTESPTASSHFPLPPREMSVKISELTAKYGLDVWMWWPIPANDYQADPKAASDEIDRIVSLTSTLFRLDALFIPGGDPGGTSPLSLFSFIKALRPFLNSSTEIWISAQEFNEEDNDKFISLSNECAKNQCNYLSGVVYGPHTRIPLSHFRSKLDSSIRIRHYPDIGHDISCEFPVPNWSPELALTLQRENFNPRPKGFSKIFKHMEAHADGFGAYSDGSADDVNKFVWAMLGWDKTLSYHEIVHDYANFLVYFPTPNEENPLKSLENEHQQKSAKNDLGKKIENSNYSTTHKNIFAKALLQLERNWSEKLEIMSTFELFELHISCSGVHASWRLLHACYRAYYDAYVYQRFLADQNALNKAKQALLSATESTIAVSLQNANTYLSASDSSPSFPLETWKSEIFSIAQRLFQLIKVKLSVSLYDAAGLGRGASLDSIDNPISDRPFWLKNVQKIMKESNSTLAMQMIQSLLTRDDPGPNGFYDNLGVEGKMPHLYDPNGSKKDFSFFHTTYNGFQEPFNGTAFSPFPLAWYTWSQVLYDNVLQLKYDGLNRSVQYEVEVVYAGDGLGDANNPIQLSGLSASGKEAIIHPFIAKPNPISPLKFKIPAEITQEGTLILNWKAKNGKGGNGRIVQVAEVFLRPI